MQGIAAKNPPLGAAQKHPLGVGSGLQKKSIFPWLNNLFKMSSALSAKRLKVRFAAKRMFELLNRLFNWGRSHNLQSRSKRARNRGEKAPLGCDMRVSIFKRLTQKFRHAFCTPFACKGELTLSQSFKYGRSHNLHSRNIESAESRRKNTLWVCDKVILSLFLAYFCDLILILS